MAVVAQTTMSASATATSPSGASADVDRNASSRAPRPANERFRAYGRSRHHPHALERKDVAKRHELVAGNAPGTKQHQRRAVRAREIPGCERRAGASAQIREVASFHDRPRQPCLAAEEHDQCGHARDRSVVVLEEVGNHLDPEATSVLEVTGVENGHGWRRLIGDEAAQPFHGLLAGKERKSLGLRLDGVTHVDTASNVGLAENAQLHEWSLFPVSDTATRLCRHTFFIDIAIFP